MSQAFKPARVSLLSAAIAAAMYTAPALSQDEMEDVDALLVLEEVIVTAQKRQQTIQSVPSSIAAITAENIARTNTTDFGDLGKITAGLTVDGPGDGFGNITRIRGVGSNPLSPFIRPSVGIFIDEVPIFDLASAFSNLVDIDRIEILKGPQATLFGKEVSSGAISLFTKRPHSAHIEGDVEASVATLGEMQLRGAINLPITDSVAARVSAYSTDRDDYAMKNIVDGEDVDFESNGFRTKFLWEVTDNFTAQLSYQKHESDQTGYAEDIQEYGNVNPGIAARRGVTLLEADKFDRKMETIGLPNRETDFDLGILKLEYETDADWTFTSITSYQTYKMDSSGDLDNLRNGGGDASFSMFSSFVVQASIESEGLTQELRATFEGDTLSSIIGAFYSKSFYDTYTAGNKLAIMDIPFPTDGLDPNNGVFFGDFYLPIYSLSDEFVEEWAVFTHNTYDITDDIELTFGVRYSEVRKEKLGFNQTGTGLYADAGLGGIYIDPGADLSAYVPPSQGGPFPVGTLPPLTYDGAPYGPGYPFIDFSTAEALLIAPGFLTSQWNPSQLNDKWTATTGTLKVAYRLNADVKAYIGIDRGFKAGGFNPQKDAAPAGGGTTVRITPDPFDSEYATNIEIGVKGTFRDNTLRWNSAIYRQLFEDFQVEVQDEVGVGQTVVNAAEVEVIGFESEVTWLASEKVMLDANMAYADATFKEFENADCTLPQYQAIACPNGQGTLDLTDKRVNATGRWSANFAATYTDELPGSTMSWYVRGEAAFRDDRIDFPDLDPVTKQPSYTLLNASVGLLSGDETWETVLWVKNLTDEEYTTMHNRARDNATSAANLSTEKEGVRARLGNARQFGFTARYHF